MRKTVAFGFVGTVLDYAGRGSQRWSKWRPTLCLCQQESLVIDRLELLHDARSRSLFETLKRDIASVSPETKVVGVEIELHNPWDFEEVYACLHDFARGYAFQPDKEEYFHRHPRRADLLVSAGRSALPAHPVDTIFTTAQKRAAR